MLNFINITVSFGGRDLYKNISFQINPKDKIGIVGKMVQVNHHAKINNWRAKAKFRNY